MVAQMKFERHEKKYLLDRSALCTLLESLSPHLEEDERARYSICSLYFDTPNFSLAQREGSHPKYKEKLRLRSYGVPEADDIVYLELKKKLDGVTYKRRMPLSMREAKAYLQAGIHPRGAGQVFNEIDWFAEQNNLEPKAIICYDRIALHGRDDPSLRVTADVDLRSRMDDLDLSHGSHGTLLIPQGKAMMEVKVSGAMPLFLAEALSDAKVYPSSFSKYGSTCRNISPKDVRLYA